MAELPLELNIITLNCWGLLHLSARRAERLTAIGQYLAHCDPSPHIVALQECWTQEDYRNIRRETRFVLPFGKFYHAGAFGAGLAILSRWPIEESTMYQYPLNGRPTAFFRGDWYVGKGVACARIRYGSLPKDIVEVFNTHMHSIYEHPPSRKDSYYVHRLSQSWELAKLIRAATERGHLALALGDFNDVPLSSPYRLMTAHSPIRDVWRVLHPDSSLGSAEHEMERARRRPIPTAAFNIDENGVTSSSAYNTWAWKNRSRSERERHLLPLHSDDEKQRRRGQGEETVGPLVDPDTLDKRGKRLDYIFFSRGACPSNSTMDVREITDDRRLSQPRRASGLYGEEQQRANMPPPGWVVKDVRVGLTERHPDLACSLSDHFSVEATLLFHIPRPGAEGGGGGRRHIDSLSVSSNDNDHRLGPAYDSKDHTRRPPSRGSVHSGNSTEAGARTLGDRALAVEKGTFLQTPRASLDSPSRFYDNDNDGEDDSVSSSGNVAGRPSTTAATTATHHQPNTQFHRPFTASKNRPNASNRRTTPAPKRAQNLLRRLQNYDAQLRDTYPPACDGLPCSTYDEMLAQIRTYVAREEDQKRYRSLHFWFWILANLAFWVGVWFVPAPSTHAAAFVFLLVGSLGMVAGVVDGLLALLFFGREIRSLREFEWEIMNAKALASGANGLVIGDEEKSW